MIGKGEDLLITFVHGHLKPRYNMNFLKIRPLNVVATMGVVLATFWPLTPVFANGYGEDPSWQFKTTADFANEAAVETLIQQKQHHMFQPPNTNYNYTTATNTTINGQQNCTAQAVSTGNAGTNTTSGNSANSSGGLSTATGNSTSTAVNGNGTTGTGTVGNTPSNSGAVGASYNGGNTSNSAGGNLQQALNSTQTNSAAQNSSNTGTACSGSVFNSGSSSGSASGNTTTGSSAVP